MSKQEVPEKKLPVQLQEAPMAVAQQGGRLAQLSAAQQDAMFGQLDDEDFKLPRLVTLEGLSPEVADGLGKAGDLFVKGLNLNLGPGPVEVIVLCRSKSRMRWQPLEEGGGIMCNAIDGKTGMGEPGGQCRTCPFQMWQGRTKPLCDLYENFIVLVRGSDVIPGMIPIAISGARTRLGGLRDFNTMLEVHRYQNRPLFDKCYKLTVVEKQNPQVKGSRYHVFQLTPGNNNQLLPQEEQQALLSIFQVVSQKRLVIEQEKPQPSVPGAAEGAPTY